MKEQLTNFAMVTHGNKQKTQMHTTKRNKQQQNRTQKREKEITKTKATGKNLNK